MARPRRYSEEVKGLVLAALREGKSQGQTAKAVGIPVGSVKTIGRAAGFVSNRTETKIATAAARRYAKEGRLNLLEAALERVRGFWGSAGLKARDASPLAIATGVLIDKTRLEDGAATERVDVNLTADSARERVLGELARLAARSRPESVAQEPTH